MGCGMVWTHLKLVGRRQRESQGRDLNRTFLRRLDSRGYKGFLLCERLKLKVISAVALRNQYSSWHLKVRKVHLLRWWRSAERTMAASRSDDVGSHLTSRGCIRSWDHYQIFEKDIAMRLIVLLQDVVFWVLDWLVTTGPPAWHWDDPDGTILRVSVYGGVLEIQPWPGDKCD